MAKKPTNYAINEERPYGILIAGHYAETAGYSIHRPPDPVGWLLMYTLTGEGQVQVAGEAVPCRPGDAVILLPGLPHHYSTAGARWEFIWVHFIPDPSYRPWLNLPQQSEGFVRLHVDASPGRNGFAEALQRMDRYSSSGGNSEIHHRLAELALEEALLLLRAEVSKDRGEAALDPRIADVVGYLRESYRERVSIPELAKRCCMSPSRLSHLFKEQVGDTIIGTVNKIRLEKAAQLLAFTTRQVAEIAGDVGFDSPDHFARLFCQVYGETPSGYRKRKRAMR
ncbi:MAG: helix-turn-helix domain-containing protein [Paenibacillus sp.]|uniref:helix-turn-helix domain-containing protein n=1 Tax=Paenibacillus sp. TaxID=58172 RepID=UPI0028FFCA45|nr:helix-turn-helix domain-containing protein [Paenibacillus sp.]MDU2243365.1 helix-turn-helix domain-containing protein [Paenibacillus sp.]